MIFTFRPIDVWPGPLTRSRSGSPFTGHYQDSLNILDRELRALNAKRPVIQLALTESDIRNDGLPRAHARPTHPGVIVAFDSKHGPLKYATDRYGDSGYDRPGWHANLRAIALGLEALRKVDRYGIAQRGEQYTGWKALGSGIAMPSMSVEDAAQFLADSAGVGEAAASVVSSALNRAAAYRMAAKRLHPDLGGDPQAFLRLQEALRVLEGA